MADAGVELHMLQRVAGHQDPAVTSRYLHPEWKLGQAHHDVPPALTSLVPQPIHRGVDIFTTGGERLADDLDVPRPEILAM